MEAAARRSGMAWRVAAVVVLLMLAPAMAAAGGGDENHEGVMEYLKCQLCETPRLTGDIDDACCCDLETVATTNRAHFLPILQNLTQRTFFRYFQADLWRDCEFWRSEGSCMSPHCSVCECDPEELPKPWLASMSALSPSFGCGESELGRLELGDGRVGTNFTAWELRRDSDARSDDDLEWTVSDLSVRGANPKYIDLLANPERYTGFSGEDAHKIWTAIKDENCFEDSGEGTCLEERVFGRIVSGLQASISSHLATKFPVGPDSWGPNVDLYVAKVGKHREWLKNLHFLFLFMVRAVDKAAPLLSQQAYFTGNPEDDAMTLAIVRRLLQVEVPTVLRGFDESQLFAVRSEDLISSCPPTLHGLQDIHELRHRFLRQKHLKEELKQDFRNKFRNISLILNCVTCVKCRLWGKLQFLGIGTALKVLFAEVDDAGVPQISLSKNEIVALINALHQFSRSLFDVQRMRDLEAQVALRRLLVNTAGGLLAVCAALYCVLRRCRRRRTPSAPSPRKEKQT